MKTSCILFIIFGGFLFSSCSKTEPAQSLVIVKEAPKLLTPNSNSKLRYPESLKRYAIGRYVDPHNRRVMHEAHDLYRIETSGKWNRHPQRSVSRLINEPPPNQPLAPATDSDDIIRLKRQLNQERETTRTIIAANKKMQEQVAPLFKTVENAKNLVEQNAKLRRQLHDLKAMPKPPLKKQEDAPAKPSLQSPFKEWFDATAPQ